jgi:glycosyltransferase involved in cell wall biosynthesis
VIRGAKKRKEARVPRHRVELEPALVAARAAARFARVSQGSEVSRSTMASVNNDIRLPGLLYACSTYQSHARAGSDYRRVLSRWYPEVRVESPNVTRFGQNGSGNSENRNVVILQVEPTDYGELFERYEILKHSYVIAMCVWEATVIPEAFRSSLAHVQEVWTCSKYCMDCFATEHDNVIYMPHIVERDRAVTEADRREMRAIVDYDEECVYYLSIANRRDRRKNSQLLIDRFQRVAGSIPRARLIVKSLDRENGIIGRDGPITYVEKQLSDGQVNSLYEIADVYVSAHHSEGWGLTMSDALLFNKPVIATGYSGNLEYMDRESGLLLDFEEEYIHPPDRFYLFDETMKWAYPAPSDLDDKLIWCYRNAGSERMRALVRNGAANATRFTSEAIEKRLISKLEALCE